jgi:L-asparaginase/Glu-tRNA(Gln) amidotransferase subunit D
MDTASSVHCSHVSNEHKAKHLQNRHQASSASEVFLRTFRRETGIPLAPLSRSKDGESRVLVLYTGGTIGMMKDDNKGMIKSVILLVTLIISSEGKIIPLLN